MKPPKLLQLSQNPALFRRRATNQKRPQASDMICHSETALIIAQKTADARSQIDEKLFGAQPVDNVDNSDKIVKVLYGWFFCRLQSAYG